MAYNIWVILGNGCSKVPHNNTVAASVVSTVSQQSCVLSLFFCVFRNNLPVCTSCSHFVLLSCSTQGRYRDGQREVHVRLQQRRHGGPWPALHQLLPPHAHRSRRHDWQGKLVEVATILLGRWWGKNTASFMRKFAQRNFNGTILAARFME